MNCQVEYENAQSYRRCHLVVLVSLRLVQRFRTLNVEQNMREGSDSVGVTPHHQVSESDVVVGRDLARRNARVQCLRTESASIKEPALFR